MRAARSIVFWSTVLPAILVGSVSLSAAPGPGSVTTAVTRPVWSPFLEAGAADMSGSSESLALQTRSRLPAGGPLHGSVVYLELLNSDGFEIGNCSGTIIGNGAVLTAAHCLVDGLEPEEVIDAIRVIAGRAGFTEPFGSQLAAGWVFPSEYLDADTLSEAITHDFGLVFLPNAALTDAAGTVPGGLLAAPDGAFTNRARRFAAVGYPFDCDAMTCGPDLDSIFGQGQYAWVAPATFVAVKDSALYSDSSLSPGMSGGPLLRTSDMAVVGVTSTGGSLLNNSTRITPAVIARLQSWCQLAGCTLNVGADEPSPQRNFRLFAGAIAGDSTLPNCTAEPSFLLPLSGTGEKVRDAVFTVALALLETDLEPGSPAWRAELTAAIREFESAATQLERLQAPNARFSAYVAEVQLALAEYSTAFELLESALDANSLDALFPVIDHLDAAELHLAVAAEAYPGVDGQCLAAFGKPFDP